MRNFIFYEYTRSILHDYMLLRKTRRKFEFNSLATEYIFYNSGNLNHTRF